MPAVSSSRLWLYALWIPAATLVIMHGGCALSRRRALNEAVLGLLSSLGAALLIVSGVKVCVGRLRPDFLARCVPVAKACTGDPHDILEGRKSFPSGHTALAFAGLGYLSLCLYARFLHARHPAWAGNLWKGVLAALPTAVALAIGLSRIADYWHHWQVARAVLRCKHVVASADTLHRACRKPDPPPLAGCARRRAHRRRVRFGDVPTALPGAVADGRAVGAVCEVARGRLMQGVGRLDDAGVLTTFSPDV